MEHSQRCHSWQFAHKSLSLCDLGAGRAGGLPLAILMGMRCNRGFTLIELMVVLGLAGVVTAVAIPVFIESSARNGVWTASELIGAQIRQARLKAISRNSRFRVRFDCPAAGNFRVLVVTGDPLIDDAVDRCGDTQLGDSGVMTMPTSVGFGNPPVLEVNGRGIYSAIGFAIPQTITVSYGARSRTLTVTATGQITFSAF